MLGDLIGRADVTGRPALIGVAGAQGSGKTTLAKAAARRFGGAQLSLDDVYRTRAERRAMARDIHPLFAVRGPPGTHDLGLMAQTLAALAAAGPDDETPLPAFDKLADDRAPQALWPRHGGRPAVVLIDGWRLGALPQDAAALAAPVNELERTRDADGVWRRAANRFLAEDRARLDERLDGLLFLRAPDLETVLDWRCQQQAGLMGMAPQALPEAERARMAGFIAHFERLTRHMLAGGVRADVTVSLDVNRHPLM